MKVGLPPSSHAFVRGTAALDTERGNLRESLAGLRNLAQLLHSLRVASRPLSNVLPAAREACEQLGLATGEILAAMRSMLQDSEAADSLQAYVAPRIAQLSAALSESSQKPLSVKTRLQLEELVTRLVQDLDTARCHFDLLADAVCGRPIPLNVLDLARETFNGPPSTTSWPHETLVATLSGGSPGFELELNPRAATSLIAFGVELVADPGDATRVPHIQLSPGSDGSCNVSIEQNPHAGGEDLVLVRRGVIPPTLACVTAAARAHGATLAFDAERHRFSLTFAKAHPERLHPACSG